LATVDSLMYPLAHRAISLAFGALRTSFLPALKSVHDTWLGPRRGHHRCWLASAHCRSGHAHFRTDCVPPPCLRKRTALALRHGRLPPLPATAIAAARLPPQLTRPALLPWWLTVLMGAWVTSTANTLHQDASVHCRAMPCFTLPWPGVCRVHATRRPSPCRYYSL